MKKTAPAVKLLHMMGDFLARKEREFSQELGSKYGVPPEEVSDVVRSFLRDCYGPATGLAKEISEKSGPLLLFIGKKDCAVCRRCEPVIEDFLSGHEELELISLDYSQPEGLIYHIIVNQEAGMLPLIAFILQGELRLYFTGECAGISVYERCYSEILTQCSQNLYAN